MPRMRVLRIKRATRLRLGYNTNTDTIAALCEYLNCTPCDFLEYVRPEKGGPKGNGPPRKG